MNLRYKNKHITVLLSKLFVEYNKYLLNSYEFMLQLKTYLHCRTHNKKKRGTVLPSVQYNIKKLSYIKMKL